MKQPDTSERQLCLQRAQPSFHNLRRRDLKNVLTLLIAILAPWPARASLFQGEQLDYVANILSWVVLVVVPIVVIGVFWIIHILPEKIAEKRHHPQTRAIQCLCLLSLVFGGLLWPIAWLWAYSKPVLHKMAYGTDVDRSHGHSDTATDPHTERDQDLEALSDEAARLRARIAELKAVLGNKGVDV